MQLYQVRRSLHELDQNAFAAGVGMNESDVAPRRALPDSARREAYASRGKPFDGGGEIVHPEPDVIESRFVRARASVRIERLEEVHADAEGPRAGEGDQSVDVFRLISKRSSGLESQGVYPQRSKRLQVQPSDCNLLNAKNFEWTVCHVLLVVRIGLGNRDCHVLESYIRRRRSGGSNPVPY